MLSCGGLVSIPLARVRLGSVFGKESSGKKIAKGGTKIRGCVHTLCLGRDGSQMVEGKFCYLASRVHPWPDDLQRCNIAGIEYL